MHSLGPGLAHGAQRDVSLSRAELPASTHVTVAFVPRGTSVEQLARRALAGAAEPGWGRSPRSRPISTSPRATGSSTPCTTPSFPRSGGTARPGELWSIVPTPPPPTSSPGCCNRLSEAAGVAVGGGPERLVLFRRPNLGRPRSRLTGKVKWRAPSDRAPTFEVRVASLRSLSSMGSGLRRNDLLIAVEKPPRPKTRHWQSGSPAVASTATSPRTAPASTATSSPPTSRRRSSTASASSVPSQMSASRSSRGVGRPGRGRIPRRADGRRSRERRGPVIGFALLAWAVALALVAAVGRGRLARPAVKLACLSVDLPAAGAPGRCRAGAEPGRRTAACDLRRAAARRPDSARPAGLPGAGAGERRDRARLRGRRDRRVAVHLAGVGRAQPRPRRALLRDRQRARGVAHGPDPRRHRRGAGGLRTARIAAPGGRRLPGRRLLLRLRLRGRALRRRRRGGDRPPARRRGRGGGDGRLARPPRRASRPRRAGRGGGAAGAGRPPLRRQRPPHPLGARRRRPERPRRRRPAPPAALRPHLREADRLPLPAAAGRRRHLGAAAPRPGRGLAGRRARAAGGPGRRARRRGPRHHRERLRGAWCWSSARPSCWSSSAMRGPRRATRPGVTLSGPCESP